jgi:hypothetical protein
MFDALCEAVRLDEQPVRDISNRIDAGTAPFVCHLSDEAPIQLPLTPHAKRPRIWCPSPREIAVGNLKLRRCLEPHLHVRMRRLDVVRRKLALLVRYDEKNTPRQPAKFTDEFVNCFRAKAGIRFDDDDCAFVLRDAFHFAVMFEAGCQEFDDGMRPATAKAGIPDAIRQDRTILRMSRSLRVQVSFSLT